MHTDESGKALSGPPVKDEKRHFWESLSLRSRLMLLTGATILPFAVFSVLAFTAMLHQQKLQLEQATMGMARALAAAIDARNQQTIAALEAFSLAQSLDEAEDDSLPAAHAAARLIRSSRPEVRTVVP